MKRESAMHHLRAPIASILVLAAMSAGAESFHASTFATGATVHATNPDSVALTKNSVWVSYTNDTTGLGGGGSSTVVRYRLNGSVRRSYSIAGSVDGLKVDPSSGLVWALQNQDGNSTITLINADENTVSQLSITHIFGRHQISEFDIGETGHSTPDNHVARRRILGTVQIAAEARELDQAGLERAGGG